MIITDTLPTVLIIEDENKFSGLLSRIIEMEGYTVVQAPSARVGMKLLATKEVKVVISDVKLPDTNGVDLVKQIKDQYPHVEVINLTAFGSIKDCVKAIKNGAFDYIMKGDDSGRIIPIVSKAMEKAMLQYETVQQNKQQENGGAHTFKKILGRSHEILNAIELAEKVCHTDTTVLLLGETGTGKEVFARALHEESSRRGQPFVAINCSSFSNELLKSELFGHIAGAFTGAMKDKKGLFEEADGGTLFLDEIGEMNIELQAKLLRVLEDGSFNRLGESKSRRVNTRIIAATNKNLKEESENNHFRLDLYYRLAVFTIHLPPLRERRDDIELLATHFLNEYSSRFKKKITGMDERFIRALKTHAWKGNVRELRNVIERAVITTNKPILTREQLDFEFFADISEGYKRTLNLESIEKQYIQKALGQAKGNKSEAARLLGIGLSTLYRKLDEYKL